MKILIVIIRWAGGVGRVVQSLKPLLEKKGHQVEVISRKDWYGYVSSSLKESVDNKDYDILYTQDWSCAFPFLFRKNHYCCFHGHNPTKLGYFIQTLVGKIMGSKLIVVGDSLKKRFPKSTLIYNGVDPNVFYDMKKERKYLGWINRSYEKINKKEVEELSKKYKLPLSVCESIPSSDMNEWYNSLKAFVSYPEDFTGFNLCWLEAKASGVPKILGNENGIGITRVKNNPIEKFSWSNHVNKLLEVIKCQ